MMHNYRYGFGQLREELQSTCSDMIVLFIFETKNNRTYVYQIRNNFIKEICYDKILAIEEVMTFVAQRYAQEQTSEEKMGEIVKKLAKEHKTIATMESCTGGALASQITNIEGSSEILKESYVSYCNDAKIKFGVPAQTIEEYTVYSAQTAIAMATAVRDRAKSDFGVGVTGQLGRIDPNNPNCLNDRAWYAINENGKLFVCKIFMAGNLTRLEKKEIIIAEVIESLYNW